MNETTQAIGENILVEETDDEIIIRILKDVDLGPSPSGKTHAVAKTDRLEYVEVNGQRWSLSLGLWKPVNRSGR